MKEFLKSLVISLGVMSLVMACEPGGGGVDALDDGTDTTDETDGTDYTDEGTDVTDETDGTDYTDETDGTDETDETDGTDETDETDETDGTDETDETDGTDEADGAEGYPVIQIQDDPNNSTLDPCDKGTKKSPGSDIDAAELLDAESTLKGYLATCELKDVSGCASTNADAQWAQGGPDLPDGEIEETYVSLNGGQLNCTWDEGATASPGDSIVVYEVGGSSTTQVEQYTVRLCDNLGGGCTADVNYASGQVTIDVDSFF
jgi:hypothetical protein